MFIRRTDLPLERDALGRFLPWIIAFMAYLAILASAGVLILHMVAGRWDQGVTGTWTVQVAPADDPGLDEARARAVLGILRTTPEVARAEAMSEGHILALLEPWLGREATTTELPLPHLIDVELRPDTSPDMEALQDRLAQVASDVSIDDHRVWLERFLSLVRSAQILAGAVLALIVLATMGTVVFTTRTGLAIHRDVIEVLHLIGAQDSYVAGQFSNRALALGLRGGLLSLALAVPTLLGLGHLAARMEGGLLPDVSLGIAQWSMVAILPVGVALLSAATARITVLRTLARML